MRAFIRIALTALAAIAIAAPLSAHHSHSMFDHDREITVTGTVTKFSFLNPHVFLFIDVEQDDGETVNYWVEMSNIPNMIKRGIGPRTFQPGDEVTVNLWPLRDDRPGGNYITIIDADGKHYE
jgi:hypothetical protein